MTTLEDSWNLYAAMVDDVEGARSRAKADGCKAFLVYKAEVSTNTFGLFSRDGYLPVMFPGRVLHRDVF
jgi:hypothetical protein